MEEMEILRQHTKQELKKHVAVVKRHGYPVEYCYALGIDSIERAGTAGASDERALPACSVLHLKLIFQRGHYWPRVLYTQAALALEWRLTGLQTVVLAVAGGASVHPV